MASEAPEGEDPEVVAAELEYFTDVEKALAQYQQQDEGKYVWNYRKSISIG